MKDQKINNRYTKKRILICPLDWGLGHTTRCIPIIYALRGAGVEVICAGDYKAEIILKKEFPGLLFLPLKGYDIKYAASKRWFATKIISQLPSIVSAISYEHSWLKKVVAAHNIDAVISDNRPGLYHSVIPTVYITHQLFIETGFSWLNKIVQQVHYKYINRFTSCWVPDEADKENLAGKLSHPAVTPDAPVSYLGPLSRFKKEPAIKGTELLVLLSGPEPQRTLFENILISQLKEYENEVILVRGLPGEKEGKRHLPAHIRSFNHLPAEKLGQLIQESKMIVARAGYTTIMDLAILQQSAILVPTPGQGEQEYLAKNLTTQNIFYSCKQDGFILKDELNRAASFYAKARIVQAAFSETVITNWLEQVAKARQ
jgi:UDP-N-acetylglucosamine transferase subunit ALG13